MAKKMSTGTKVMIGAVVVAAAGGAIYFYMKKKADEDRGWSSDDTQYQDSSSVNLEPQRRSPFRRAQ